MNKDVTQFLVYQYAEQLSDVFWEEYDKWPKKVQMTIGLQIIRAADSISANIAEGFGRFHYRDRLRFYYCA
ncbi:MAG TPA: four helix bundle protein, partial [Bacteroidia bacterium]|nr:four helix bundle protein [Bacteroidia bacterium]